jgi:type IV secretion system protein VirB4
MGGDWHDLGGGLTEGSDVSVSLQPLARITTRRTRLGGRLDRRDPDARRHRHHAGGEGAHLDGADLARLRAGRGTHHHRPAVLLQSNDLKQALRPYCVGGPMAGCSTPRPNISARLDVQAFEIEGLVGTGAAPAVLAYLFHRIGDRLDGRPTLLIIDEGWLALDDEGFAGQLREWLKTLRKKNASVIFATQSLSDIDGSAIAPAIIESCPTRLLLPNERAIEPQITAIYRRFGLNDRQIEILARATPKRDYYCQSRRGNRLFELGLSEVGLALCAASPNPTRR